MSAAFLTAADMALDLLESLDKQSIQFVRVVWCDNANVIRAKAIHRAALADRQQVGVGLSAAQQAVPVMADAVVPHSGLGPVGEVWLIPDWDTLTILPYAPGQARVMGNMAQSGKPWPWCPRGFLQRMIARAAGLNLEIQAAFEPEFYLLRVAEDQIYPADETLFAATLSMDLQAPIINEIAAALMDQGVCVEHYYPESGPGQQEISVRYAPALRAADQHIIYRETVRAIARRHGLIASFLPKLFDSAAGSGCHLHLSLWRQGQNITGDGRGGLSSEAQAFCAGLLHHLKALMALTTPSTNSYRRLRPHCWSGAFQCWGYDNREAALRIPTNAEPPSPTHLELKTVDGSANPYLALGGAIAAGLDGIQQQRRLPKPVSVDPGCLSEADREHQGIFELPRDLGSVLESLKHNQVLREALGPELSQAYLAVRQAEWGAMEGMSLSQEVKLLHDRY